MPSIRGAIGLWFAYVAFVIYGSLVPLDLRPLPLDEAWRRFHAMPFLHLGVASRADWIANGVLYAPVGFLTSWLLLRRHWWTAAAGLAATALGVTLALGVEFAQVFFPARTVSLNDVLAECIGSVVGAFSALAYPGRRRFQAAVPQQAGAWIKAHGLQLYLAAYLAFCLFPYDLLLSRAEIEQKLVSDLWGWWMAGDDPRLLLAVLRLGIEVALTVPLGMLLGQWSPYPSGPGGGRAAFVGLVLGLAVEGAQLLIASGSSQGASVLTRVFGVVIGVALWRRRHSWSEVGVRAVLARSSAVWFPAYLIVLAAVNGWFTAEWQDWDAMSLRWQALRLQPFYYHYYTSEAHALSSLASVMLMYLPMAALAWAWRLSASAAVWWGALVCLIVETSKLSVAGLHPDTTNLWIASLVCWAVVRGGTVWSDWSMQASVVDRQPTVNVSPYAVAPTTERPRRHAVRSAWPVAFALMLCGWYFLSAPALAAVSAALLLACAAVVWMRPVSAVLIVPALLPLLDLAPWTGRFFWDEFDLLLGVCLAVGYLRSSSSRRRKAAGRWAWAFAAVALSLLISTAIGAIPWPWPDGNSFVSYYSPYNAMRIVKGAVWAGLFVGLFQRLRRSGCEVRTSLVSGMALGLAYVVFFVIWERLAFVGLFDFADSYRVTGPFSAMHRGGAFIECYIAVASPFAVLWVLHAQRWVARIAGTALLVAASYAMMVTFSRNGYAAFGVALVVVLVTTRASRSWRQVLFGGLLVASMLGVALPVLLGSFAQERLSRWSHDLSVRQSHWSDALSMRDGNAWTTAFGMGVGRYPETHYWRSIEPVHAGSYRLESDGDSRFLHLGGGGGTLYIDQIVSLNASQPLTLRLSLRARKPGAVLEMSLCEKWMLTSRACVPSSVRGADTPGAWSAAEATVDVSRLAEHGRPLPRTVKWSLQTPAVGTVVDVTNISLQTANGDELISNGDFQQGLDRWFFSTDVDPPWHIHSLPVAVLFDQGWFGVVTWVLLLVTAIYSGMRSAWRGDPHAAAALAGLMAYLVSGSLNTLIDEPRFLFLLLLLTALCCTSMRSASARSR